MASAGLDHGPAFSTATTLGRLGKVNIDTAQGLFTITSLPADPG